MISRTHIHIFIFINNIYTFTLFSKCTSSIVVQYKETCQHPTATHLMEVSLYLVPWAQCPLVSMTYFTKWLQFLLSIANPCRVQISLLHQSTRSSVHLLLGLPLSFLPSIMPKNTLLQEPVVLHPACDRRSSISSR